MSGLVAIAGATGAVGGHLAAMLRAAGIPARLGARRPAAGMRHVEASDSDSLEAFCRGATVLVNCVGPVRGTREKIMAAAVSAGCHYLDSAAVAADDPADDPQPLVAVLLGAGATPGISELMFRWLARRAPGAGPAITGYAATVDAMTAGATADFLELLAEPGSGAPAQTGCLPFFPGETVVHLSVSREASAAALMEGIRKLSWYQVFAVGSPVLAVLARCRLAGQDGRLPADAVQDLMAAARVELAGQSPYQQFVVERSGHDGGEVAVLRTGSTYRLTAAMLTEAVHELLRGNVSAGSQLASTALDPDCFPRALRHDTSAQLSLLDCDLGTYSGYDTGVI